MKQKKRKDSETVKTEVVCPNDTNPMGMLQGGRLVEWMDIAAAVCAQTHAEKICVTASINHVDFKHSALVGDIVTIQANITRAFKSSMEILVKAYARNVLQGERNMISEAYFTFVALNKVGESTPVNELVPETEEEMAEYEAAGRRKIR